MGHMYPDRQSRLLIEFAEQNSSIESMIKFSMKNRIKVSCAEGKYGQRYMQEMAMWNVLRFHLERGIVKVRADTAIEKAVYKAWEDGSIWDHPNLEKVGDLFNTLVVQLTSRGRNQALKGTVKHCDHVES